MTTDDTDELVVGEYRLISTGGSVRVVKDETDEKIGEITAAGLGDAARINDDCLSYIGSLEWFRQQHQQEGQDDE